MFIIGIAILAALVAFVLLSTHVVGNQLKFQLKFRSFVVAPLVLVAVASFGMVKVVGANEVGIIYDPLNGGIQDYTFDEGLHIKAPYVEVREISTKLRESSFQVYAQTGQIFDSEGNPTGGGQWVTYKVTLQYKIPADNAATFYRQFGGNVIPETVIEARLRESLQSKSVNYDVFSILKGALNEVRLETEIDLRESMSELGVYVDSFIIQEVDAGETIEGVVEDEATAAKQKEIAIKEQEATLIREETKKLQAEIEAERLVIEQSAIAEAEQLIKSITVNAINDMYNGQFTDIDEQTTFEIEGIGGFLTISEVAEIVMEQLYYDTWDGVLPEVYSGGELGLIIGDKPE